MATNPQRQHLTYTIRDYYNDYRKKANRQSKYQVRPYKQYKAYIYDIFSEIFQRIMHEAWHFVFPFSAGEFYIKKVGQGVFKQIYKKPNKDKILINNHTFRNRYKFVWDKSYSTFDNSKFYNFKIARGTEVEALKYNVGKKALSNFYFSMNENPNIKLLTPYNQAIRYLQKPTYES